jgi:hypothetical protein
VRSAAHHRLAQTCGVPEQTSDSLAHAPRSIRREGLDYQGQALLRDIELTSKCINFLLYGEAVKLARGQYKATAFIFPLKNIFGLPRISQAEISRRKYRIP